MKKFVTWFIHGPFFSLFSRLLIKEVNGVSNLPDNGGFIVAVNHTSYLDIPSLSIALLATKKLNVRYLAKKELFMNYFSRWILSIGKPIPFDRKLKFNKKRAFEVIKALKKKDVIVIYPEGTRSLTGKIQKGKTGMARLALWARVPVVPVGIKGAFELMPKGKVIPKFKKSIAVNIGAPIYFNKYYSKKTTKVLVRKLTTKVMVEIAKLSGQRYNP